MGNKWLIGAAAVFAAALPGIASADTNGHVKFTYASLDESGDPDKEHVTALSGGVVTDLGAGWRLQFNGANADMDHTGHSDAFSLVEAHGAYDFGNFSLGGFVGNLNAESIPGSYWGVGVEATATFGRFGLNGSASTFEGDGDDVTNHGVGAVFNLTDNFHFGANASWTDVGFDDVESFGVGAGYQFPNGIGLGLGWRTSEFDFADTDTIGLSVSYNFGESASGRYLPGAAGLLPDLVARQ